MDNILRETFGKSQKMKSILGRTRTRRTKLRLGGGEPFLRGRCYQRKRKRGFNSIESRFFETLTTRETVSTGTKILHSIVSLMYNIFYKEDKYLGVTISSWTMHLLKYAHRRFTFAVS